MAQTVDSRLAVLGAARIWLGLRNSDDQGARFDVRVDLVKNGSPWASGLARCVSGITRNPDKALELTIPFDSAPGVAVGPGDELAFTVSTRIGTTNEGGFCGGHSNATGLRLYFDSASRTSGPGEFFLHSAGGGVFDVNAPPAGSPAQADSPSLHWTGGNPWQVVGTWTHTGP